MSAMVAAKKKALSELIKKMRLLESKIEEPMMEDDSKGDYEDPEDEEMEGINIRLDKPGRQDAGEGQASAEEVDEELDARKIFMKGRASDKPGRASKSIIAVSFNPKPKGGQGGKGPGKKY